MIREPEREVPVAGTCDVLVAGGGPAGVSAAVAAARSGARTQLIEVHGCLGGVWTAGLLSYVLDAGNKTGLLLDLIARLEAATGAALTRDLSHDLPWVKGSFYYDPEIMKLVLEEWCAEAGVTVQLHTRIVAARRDGRNVSAAITESKSGRQAWRARVFVDATGDGDLAAFAGCGFDLGRESDGATQPLTLMAIVGGIRADELRAAIHGQPGARESSKEFLLAEMRRAGVEPSYSRPQLAHIGGDLFAMLANHEYGASGLDAAAVTRATMHARRELHRIVAGLRSLGGPWSGLRVVCTAEQISVREGRRIHGLYRITADDVVRGARHPDAVCRVTYPVDVHALKADEGRGYSAAGVRSQPYDIPIRALIARDVDNLLMAGRCISGDFLAHASYRVTGNAVAMGEAAGKLAARAALSGRTPQEAAAGMFGD